ncbi:Hypothetical predicted protein [Xyrichtys novacula]|uniref:Uncharacterized protein n=1 Tax=Xyrichtys novacula TaxID=13765 RepID=A0AAV1ERF5_XYRNO|nr:Hypothetical predicted protein [Xyrichtys novacula]
MTEWPRRDESRRHTDLGRLSNVSMAKRTPGGTQRNEAPRGFSCPREEEGRNRRRQGKERSAGSPPISVHEHAERRGEKSDRASKRTTASAQGASNRASNTHSHSIQNYTDPQHGKPSLKLAFRSTKTLIPNHSTANKSIADPRRGDIQSCTDRRAPPRSGPETVAIAGDRRVRFSSFLLTLTPPADKYRLAARCQISSSRRSDGLATRCLRSFTLKLIHRKINHKNHQNGVTHTRQRNPDGGNALRKNQKKPSSSRAPVFPVQLRPGPGEEAAAAAAAAGREKSSKYRVHHSRGAPHKCPLLSLKDEFPPGGGAERESE